MVQKRMKVPIYIMVVVGRFFTVLRLNPYKLSFKVLKNRLSLRVKSRLSSRSEEKTL